jgi:hypothetical protein
MAKSSIQPQSLSKSSKVHTPFVPPIRDRLLFDASSRKADPSLASVHDVKCDGTSDVAPAINSAVSAVMRAGGGELDLPAGLCIVGSTIMVPNNLSMTFKGQGEGVTIIKLKERANADVFRSVDFSEYTGKRASGGSWKVYFRDLTIDGNKAKNRAGYGVRLYGSRLGLSNVTVLNAAQDNIYTEWFGDKPGEDSDMSSYYVNVRTAYAGRNGFTNYGPHDSVFEMLNTWGNGCWGYQNGQTTSAPFHAGGAEHGRNLNAYSNNPSGQPGCGQVDLEASAEWVNISASGYNSENVRIGHNAGSVILSDCIFGENNQNSTSGIGLHIMNHGSTVTGGRITGNHTGLKLDGAANTNIVGVVWTGDNTTAVDFKNEGLSLSLMAVPFCTSEHLAPRTGSSCLMLAILQVR